MKAETLIVVPFALALRWNTPSCIHCCTHLETSASRRYSAAPSGMTASQITPYSAQLTGITPTNANTPAATIARTTPEIHCPIAVFSSTTYASVHN